VDGADLRADGLTACDREPIRVPGSIQPHGSLLALDPNGLTVVQAAVGSGLAAGTGDPCGQPLSAVLDAEALRLAADLDARVPPAGALHLGVARTGGADHHLIAHRSDGLILLELEEAPPGDPRSFDAVYPGVREVLASLERAESVADLGALAAREIRRITGLDRVLVYRFDPDWNGEVVGEDRNDRLPSYLGHRFPASDIPAQARDLYRLNRLRLIADATYRPIPIRPVENPRTARPLDLGFAVLRSVSPVHLEYMRNMGTLASMSISLIREDRLWGLISCHNRDPARVPYPVRTACDFIGQVLSLQLAAREAAAHALQRERLRAVETRLIARMTGAATHLDGLVANPDDLLALAGAAGAAVVSDGACRLVGETPDERTVLDLAAWLGRTHPGDVFSTDRLPALWPGGAAVKDRASGLVAIPISQVHDSWVLWFRPEVIRTITWGGDPKKPGGGPDEGPGRLHPRTSFAAWRETVRLTARPFDRAEVEAAADLRRAIVDVVLRRAEETAALSERLVAINRELEAFSYSISHDLRAPFRHIVGYAQLLKKAEGGTLSERGNRFLDTIVDSAISAGTLVDDLLDFSQMGRATITPIPVDLDALVEEVRRGLVVEGDRAIDWRIGRLGSLRADPMMLRRLVQNLLDNAIKFSRERRPAVIEVSAERTPAETVLTVRDNGTGFDMAYVGKLFGVFQRLHRAEDYEGTGIGLANVKRIAERHAGRVWAEGVLDGGAAFHVAFPRDKET
jgi:chemotaxis family two-component system sensor kinase Cph1